MKLYEDEEEALKMFELQKGESHFKRLGSENGTFAVGANSKVIVKIRFGTKTKIESSEKSKKMMKSKVSEPQKYYVAKFNILLERDFIQDVIIIGTYV
ncbi:hypothetical protein FQA39_LY16878 [Lamprigera yunnana]|nr:hypothetical protein FQA39_LY16878 [Lamprigera yunnana]